jgi:PAS domain S-box-containing protein
MALNTLTEQELQAAFRELESTGAVGTRVAEELQGVIHDLHVYRMELEAQNQALRQSREELEHSHRRYADLYDFSPIGYVTLSRVGVIEEANLTAGELLHMERSQLLGRTFRRFLDEEDSNRFYAHLEEALRGNSATLEVVLRAGGVHPPLEVQLSSRAAPGSSGAIDRVRTALTDVSMLKRTQHELQEINREQESFSYSISHDLRTPLVTISNFSSLLLREYGGSLSEEARGCAARIHRAATRMDTLLGDLLDYTRMSRGSLNLQRVPLEAVVDDVLLQLQGTIETSRARIEVRRPLAFVNASPEALGQVLTNLVTNALKFTRTGETPRITISSRQSAHRCVLVVEDDGIGIAPEHTQRIFGMFERLHSSEEFPGTGVGLAIVRRAVERMNGRIWVESAVGHGSRFFVELDCG